MVAIEGLQACDGRWLGTHAPGDLRLADARALTGFDHAAQQVEFRLKRIVFFPDSRVSEGFFFQLFMRHGFTSFQGAIEARPVRPFR